MLVDGPHTRCIPSTARTGAHDGVPQAAVSQPPRVAPIQALLPGSVELPSRGQRGILACTVQLSFLEGELLWLGRKKHLTCGPIERTSMSLNLTTSGIPRCACPALLLPTHAGMGAAYPSACRCNSTHRRSLRPGACHMSAHPGSSLCLLHSCCGDSQWDT